MTMTLYLSHGTEKAFLFMFCQKQSPDMKASLTYGAWIPKKCCVILSQDEDRANHWTECRVKVKDWFAKQSDLQRKRDHVIKHHVKNPEDFEII